MGMHFNFCAKIQNPITLGNFHRTRSPKQSAQHWTALILKATQKNAGWAHI